MTPGQSRVVVLLLILLALEAVRIPEVGNFFRGVYSTASGALGSVGNSAVSIGGNNLNPPPTNNYGNGKGWILPKPDGTCPSGTSPIHVSGGKLVCQFN